MKMILVRHGETGNRKYNGFTDVPLNEQGCRQAELVKRRLAEEPVGKIYSSDLSRAVETAKIINLAHGVAMEIDPDLREINFGLWEGLSFSEISTCHKDQFEKWMAGTVDFRFPEGENLGALEQRVGRFLAKVEREPEGEAIIVVGHGGPLRLILCEVLGLALTNVWKINLELGSISVVELGKEDQFVSLLNDTCHLVPGVLREGG